MAKQGEIRIGVSGWSYDFWRGVFYPEKLRQRDELNYVSRQLASLEINGTFYSLQRPKNFESWAAQTEPGFVFAVKATRYITHMRRLKDVEAPLANFFASGLLALGPKLAPILWQVPPNLKFDAVLIDTFLGLLPKDTAAAARLASRHEPRMNGRALVEPVADLPIRHALEVRHSSFQSPEFIEILKRHNVAVVVSDSVSWPCIVDPTADFMYLRLHGSEELYANGYDDESLGRWADRVRIWSLGDMPKDMETVVAAKGKGPPRDVYVYFDNDAKVHAPANARDLAARLGVQRKVG